MKTWLPETRVSLVESPSNREQQHPPTTIYCDNFTYTLDQQLPEIGRARLSLYSRSRLSRVLL